MESGIVKSGTGVETAVVENAQVYVFSKAEYQVDSGNRTFKVIFSAADEINRVIRQHLANRAGKHPEAFLYDAEELNVNFP